MRDEKDLQVKPIIRAEDLPLATDPVPKLAAAVELGRRGGLTITAKKSEAARRNGKLSKGRPPVNKQ